MLEILSLGNQYIINFLDSPTQERLTAPLDLVLCPSCHLLQLKHTVPRDLLFRQYWYKSGINNSMRKTLREITKKIEEMVSLSRTDIVVDIGCNDGTMLRYYEQDCFKVGFEPATNLIEEAGIGLDYLINDYFNAESYKNIFGSKKKAKIITAIAMFYDLEDPNSFVADIKELLAKDGVFVVQMNYLVLMLACNAFDNIGHEHLEYYSLTSLNCLLERHELEMFDVELNDVNYKVKPIVNVLLDYEKLLKLDTPTPYITFANRIENLKKQTFNFVEDQVNADKTVYLYGASTRGNTLLQHYGIDNKLIGKAAEKNPAKWGLTTTTLIPIVSEEEARKDKPDYFLVLPWQFIDEFVVRERAYLMSGGKFVVPLPNFQIIGSNKR